jgi:3-oxoacyl-[acyl-carrier protein] reductase
MDLGLKGKTALVAAGSRGLGKAVAERLAMEGASVVVFARNADDVETCVQGIRDNCGAESAIGLTGDVTSLADIERVIAATEAQSGGVDILINNAGGPAPGGFDDLEDPHWQAAFELTLMSAIRLTRAVLPNMRAQRWGRVINVTSFGVKQPIDQLMLSNSIRLAVIGWAKTLAKELAPEGVLVNNVCPGWTETGRVEQLMAARAAASGRQPTDVANDIIADIPMGRMGRPEEFADAVAFLASERASYITGVALAVDGGAIQAAL